MPVTPAEIARRALADHLAALPAAELLSRYATSRDPEAFAGLVRQFGPMVLGVCRRVLGPSPDADDAFQAVFLALVRHAASFRDPGTLPAWLHRVAHRSARKALARRASDPTAAGMTEPADTADPLAAVAWKDARRVLDEELDALPEHLRGPVVLCWLDGLTQDEAAGKLGFSLNTLKRRLDAGRELLRARLTRRGLAPVLAASAVLDATGLRAVVPDPLALLAVEIGVGAPVSPAVEALVAVVAATAPARGYPKVALALVLVAGVATAGVVVLADRPRPVAVTPEPQAKEEPLPAMPPPGTRIDPAVLAAWERAGFGIGFQGSVESGHPPSLDTPKRRLSRAELVALPPIRVPFSLSFGGTDAELADLTANANLTHLVRLDITRGELTNAGLLALAELPNLTELRIHYRGNAFGIEDEDELSDDLLKHLAGMKRLTTLSIWGSVGKKLPPASLAHLADVKTLSTLTIEGSSLTEEGLRHVARIPGLTTLNLGRGVLGDLGLRELAHAKGLRSLTILGGVAAAELRHLSELDLTVLDVGVTGEHLAALKNLTTLTLRGTSDEGLKHVAALKNLTTLKLCAIGVKGPGLAHLSGLKKLATLDLSELHLLDRSLPGELCIQDPSREPFGGFESLTTLDMSGTRVPPGWLKRLAGLKKLTTFVAPLGVTEEELEHLAGAENLTTLNLYLPVPESARKHLSGPKSGLRHLARLKNLKVLNLRSAVTDDALEHVGVIKSLTTLSVSGANLSNWGFEYLAGLENLTSLTIGGGKVTDEGLKHLAGLKNLTTLSLSAPRVEGPGLKHLAGLKKLSTLSLVSSVEGPGLEHLASLTNLTVLHLRCPITDEGLEHLAGVKSLMTLDLLYPSTATRDLRTGVHGPPLMKGPGLKHLSGMRSLTTLILDGNQVTDEMLRGLAEAELLHALFHSGEQPADAPPVQAAGVGGKRPANANEVVYLNLRGCPVTDAGLAHLAGLKNLTTLHLQFTQVTGTGFEHLAGLKHLYLAQSPVSDAGLEQVGKCRGLVTLDIGQSNKCTDAGLAHMAGLTNLTILYLRGDHLTGAGVDKLRSALPNCEIVK